MMFECVSTQSVITQFYIDIMLCSVFMASDTYSSLYKCNVMLVGMKGLYSLMEHDEHILTNVYQVFSI